ncbi:hypothetical protein ACVDG8_001790 [Mesorhizobium sp. ORM8.1]
MTSTKAANRPEVDLHRIFDDASHLADSLEKTVSYLEHSAEKHNAIAETARGYARATQRSERIASDLRSLDENNPALMRYRSVYNNLDAAQIEAFSRIIVDYQARIGEGFVPVSTNDYLADLTSIAFTLEAIQDPACLVGVGGGLVPRFKRGKEARSLRSRQPRPSSVSRRAGSFRLSGMK